MSVLPITKKPPQEKFLSGDEFINQSFGKDGEVPSGKVIINESIRISRYINKILDSMVLNNSIVGGAGFEVEDITTNSPNIKIRLTPGKIVQDYTLIHVPYRITITFNNFTLNAGTKGKFVIYSEFKYSDKENPQRPLAITAPRDLREPTPSDQVEFNPFILKVGFYDQLTESVEGWNTADDIPRVIIKSIEYEKNKDGTYSFIYGANSASIIIGGDTYYDRTGGSTKTSLNIDGGLYS